MSPTSLLPSEFETVEALEEFLSRPTAEVVEAIGQLDGDVMILGAGGKMGPTLAMLAWRAVSAAGVDKRVIGVSDEEYAELEREGHIGMDFVPGLQMGKYKPE